jgi:uncharacterized protein DUF3558
VSGEPRSRLRHTARLLVLVGLLAGALLGCGGGAGPGGTSAGPGASQAASQPNAASPAAVATNGGSSGSTIDPCALLTTDEVEAKSGDTVSKTEKSATGCTWWLGKDATSWIKLVVWPNGRATFEAMAPAGTAVAGLGDKAFSDGSTLVALKGDTMLQLGSEIVLSPADPAIFSRPLMELALARV